MEGNSTAYQIFYVSLSDPSEMHIVHFHEPKL